MNQQLLILALATAALSVVLAAVLFVVKLTNWRLAAIRGERRARYIAAVGEIVARDLDVGYDPGWADDPLFHDVLMQYTDVVAGEEGEALERLISELDLRSRLVVQLRTARRRSRRLMAASHLAVIASPEVEWALIEGLTAPETEIRVQAARGLAKIKSERAIPTLVHMLLTERPWVAARIADQLVEYGPLAVPMLLENTRDEHHGFLVDPATQAVLIRVLGMIGDRRAGPAIEPLLDHHAWEVRAAAATALGSAGAMSGIPALVEALEDEAWEVRARAAASLAAFSDPDTVEPVVAALRDPSFWVRQNAAAALTEILGGIDALVDTLESDDDYARDAALQQLGLSGALRAARQRVADGSASEQDVRMIELVDRRPEPPADSDLPDNVVALPTKAS